MEGIGYLLQMKARPSLTNFFYLTQKYWHHGILRIGPRPSVKYQSYIWSYDRFSSWFLCSQNSACALKKQDMDGQRNIFVLPLCRMSHPPSSCHLMIFEGLVNYIICINLSVKLQAIEDYKCFKRLFQIWTTPSKPCQCNNQVRHGGPK